MKALALVTAIVYCMATGPVRAAEVTFGAFGDTPYFAFEELAFSDLIARMSAEPLAFVVNIGDFKSGISPCTDELNRLRHEQFQQSAHPLLFLPADNEWTDCHRVAAGRMDPLDRLASLRALFHGGDAPLGRRGMPITRQSSDPRFALYRENMRWTVGGVAFAAMNVPGSNNNFGRTDEMDAEHHARMAANETWLAATVRGALADGARALVLFFHANPLFERDARPPPRRDGYRTWRAMLADAARRFPRPILLVHGDSHTYRVDQPMRGPGGETVPHVTRLEVFGSPVSNWVRVTVTDDRPAKFRIEPGRKIEEANP